MLARGLVNDNCIAMALGDLLYSKFFWGGIGWM